MAPACQAPTIAVSSRLDIVEAILDKHTAATASRKFNALLATASINDAIEYFSLFTSLQAARQKADPAFQPLNVGCVFSPPAQLAQTPEEKKDIAQLAEDLVGALLWLLSDQASGFVTGQVIAIDGGFSAFTGV